MTRLSSRCSAWSMKDGTTQTSAKRTRATVQCVYVAVARGIGDHLTEGACRPKSECNPPVWMSRARRRARRRVRRRARRRVRIPTQGENHSYRIGNLVSRRCYTGVNLSAKTWRPGDHRLEVRESAQLTWCPTSKEVSQSTKSRLCENMIWTLGASPGRQPWSCK